MRTRRRDKLEIRRGGDHGDVLIARDLPYPDDSDTYDHFIAINIHSPLKGKAFMLAKCEGATRRPPLERNATHPHRLRYNKHWETWFHRSYTKSSSAIRISLRLRLAPLNGRGI
jgi:hypothetical protein